MITLLIWRTLSDYVSSLVLLVKFAMQRRGDNVKQQESISIDQNYKKRVSAFVIG
jgi:hypothetical protein